MMAVNHNKYDRISFNCFVLSLALKTLISKHGDYLESLSIGEKYQLLGVLAHWGAINQLHPERDYSIADSVEDYPGNLSDLVLSALNCLVGLSAMDAQSLMVTISNQIKNGVYRA